MKNRFRTSFDSVVIDVLQKLQDQIKSCTVISSSVEYRYFSPGRDFCTSGGWECMEFWGEGNFQFRTTYKPLVNTKCQIFRWENIDAPGGSPPETTS